MSISDRTSPRKQIASTFFRTMRNQRIQCTPNSVLTFFNCNFFALILMWFDSIQYNWSGDLAVLIFFRLSPFTNCTTRNFRELIFSIKFTILLLSDCVDQYVYALAYDEIRTQHKWIFMERPRIKTVFN